MRTTIDMPDELLERAKLQAASQGVSLGVFVIGAVEAQLKAPRKPRLEPPTLKGGAGMAKLSADELDALMFG